jgi:serine phosphatase RsbU (regulator of sigma subunit)
MTRLLTTLLLLFSFRSFAQGDLAAREGMLDLRHVSLDKMQVPLQGEWLFYPKVFLKSADLLQPDFSSQRSYKVATGSSWTEHPELQTVQFGTFLMRLNLPSHDSYLLGIQEDIGINSAFELELAPEGKVIARSGRIAQHKELEVAWWQRKIFPLLEVGRQQVDLLLRVSSFSYDKKGILVPPRIGEWMQMTRRLYLQRIGVLAATATLLSLAVYHFILFMIRRDDRTNLVFAASSFLMVFRLVTSDRVIEELFPEGLAFYANINFRILYSLMIIIPVLLHTYFCCLIDDFLHRLRPWARWVLIVSAVLAILPFCVPDYPTLHGLVFLFELFVSLSALVAMALLVRHALYHPVHQFEARICLGLGVCFLISIANDIGYMHYFWDTMTLSHYALIGLYIGQSVLVARKYRKDYALRQALQESIAVQEAFLPAIEQFPGLRTSSYYQAADQQAGGDLYDLHFDSENQRIYVFIGDVTGHGIASALVTGAASGAIHSTLSVCKHQNLDLENTLRELVHALNTSVLSAGRRADRFMTFTMMGLDVRTGEGIYVNAGHNASFLIKEGKIETLIRSSSPLGLHDNVTFEPVKFQIQTGQRIFLYTDGLVENEGEHNRTLKLRKLTRLIADAGAIQEARAAILQYGQEVWGHNPPEDDVTFVILEWAPDKAA